MPLHYFCIMQAGQIDPERGAHRGTAASRPNGAMWIGAVQLSMPSPPVAVRPGQAIAVAIAAAVMSGAVLQDAAMLHLPNIEEQPVRGHAQDEDQSGTVRWAGRV